METPLGAPICGPPPIKLEMREDWSDLQTPGIPLQRVSSSHETPSCPALTHLRDGETETLRDLPNTVRRAEQGVQGLYKQYC